MERRDARLVPAISSASWATRALIYNKRQKEIEDGRELAFTWLEVDLQNGTLPVRLRMNDVSGIAEDAADMLSLGARRLQQRASWAAPTQSPA